MTMTPATASYITDEDYPFHYAPSARSTGRDVTEIPDIPLLQEFGKTLLPLEVDPSSVSLRIQVSNESRVSGGSPEEAILAKMVTHDIIVRMSPKRTYPISLRITAIEKAKPKVVKPDWIAQ